MTAISCKANEMVLKHWDTGEVILSQPTGINDEAAPSMIEHRGYFKSLGERLNLRDYHMIMFDHAPRMGADIRMRVRVQRYDDDKPSVVLDSGEEYCADIVIGADGTGPIARV
jgi:2-polyprenyl-6-methoxyphenol hydroxylase-like FAD-dependent oxidoreductase